MKFQIERALRPYDEALALLPAADRQAQKPGLMMASIYRTLLHEIAREPQLVLTRRVSLTPLRKLWLAWKVTGARAAVNTQTSPLTMKARRLAVVGGGWARLAGQCTRPARLASRGLRGRAPMGRPRARWPASRRKTADWTTASIS